MVINFELAVHVELHGVVSAIRSLPGFAGTLLSLRPRDARRLLPRMPVSNSARSRIGSGDEWQTLASRMDTELDHIGSARLLASHTPHESCVRTPPTEARPLLSFTLVPLQSTSVLSSLPFANKVERVVGWGLTTALNLVDRVVPAAFAGSVERLGVRKVKGKTD